MKYYFDTSVLIAFAVRGHGHHPAALAAMEQMIAGRHHGYVSAHGLAETYSVLTRTPFTPPLYPSEAWTILERSILPHFTVVSLDAAEYQEVLRDCAARGWSGGRVYDMLHLKCAQKERCDRIYTFNVRHFRELAPASLSSTICSP